METNSASKFVQDVVASLNEEKVWPSDVALYTVPENKELLTDVARTHVVQALFAVHGLVDCYAVERRHNAEFMAPKNGRLPFMATGKKVIGEEDILEYLSKNQFILRNDMTTEDTIIVQGIISLIETKLVPVELYSTWVVPANLKSTRARYGLNMPKPLNMILYYQKSKEIHKHLKALGLLDKSEAQIREDVLEVYKCISDRLVHGTCMIGEEITEADVYVYGHLQAILESKLEVNILMQELRHFPKLTQFCLNFNQIHLGNKAMIWEFL